MNRDIYMWIWRAIYILSMALVISLIISLFLGCSHCKPEIVYQPVEVKIPVPVNGPPLPVPEPVACPPRPEGWRGSAAYLKGCYEAALTKIEELLHVIESYNESLEPPSQ